MRHPTAGELGRMSNAERAVGPLPHRHEVDRVRIDTPAHLVAGSLVQDKQRPGLAGVERRHNPATFGQLVDPGGRNMADRAGSEDAIERAVLCPAFRTIPRG